MPHGNSHVVRALLMVDRHKLFDEKSPKSEKQPT